MHIKRIYVIDNKGKTVFKGPVSNLKFKPESVKEMSIKLFNDENPCIIHESYAIEQLATEVERILLSKQTLEIRIDVKLQTELPELELMNYLNHTFKLDVKSWKSLI